MKVTGTSKKVNLKSRTENFKILVVTLCKFPQSPILGQFSILLL